MFIHSLNSYFRRRFLIVIITVFFLLSFFYLNQSTNEKKIFQCSVPQGQIINRVSPGLPVRLIIPAINVDANVKYLGVTQTGEMEVPNNVFDVGWFKLGPRPGEKGNSVIAGHFNGENGEAGVFTDLYKLKKGDNLYIKNDKGLSVVFVVRESRIYDPGYADDVFSESDNAHLNLITCDGLWDGAEKSYSKRLVVFTDILQ